jgi:hypothetical protein
MSNSENILNIADIMAVQTYGVEHDSFQQKIYMHVGLKRERGERKQIM